MPKDQRAGVPGFLASPVIGLSRRVRFGVAGRILFANSIMLVGIMVLTTSMLYIQLSQLNTKREQDLLRSAAESISLSLSLIEVEEAAAGNEFPSPSSQKNLQAMLANVVAEYHFDTAAIVPIDYLLEPPALGTSGKQTADETDLVTANSGSVPSSSIDRLAARVDGSSIAGGKSVVRFIDDGGPEDGTMYAVTPVRAEHLNSAEEQPGSGGAPGFAADADPQTVIGAVIVGSTADSVRAGFIPQSKWLIGIAIATLIMGIGSSWVTSRGLRRVTGDYGATELRNMLEFYSSVLTAVSEGLLLVDRSAGIVLINAEARELLGLPPAEQKTPGQNRDTARSTIPETAMPLEDLDVPSALRELLASGRWARDEIHYTDERVLVVNQQPTEVGSDTWVVTMRDHTELAELSGELVSVRSFSDSLRSQTHEYANRLHMVVSLLETGHTDEAIEFAAKDLDDLNRVTGKGQMSFDHPVLSALLLSKIAQAAEAGIEMTVDTTDLTGRLGGDDRDLATILGNLIDNAFDALSRQDVLSEDKRVHVHLSGAGGPGGFTIEVSDDGPGIDEEHVDAIFERGWSTKHDGVETDSGRGRQETGTRGVGLSLVVQAIRRLGGAIDVQGRGEDGDELKGAVLTVWLPDRGSDRPRAGAAGNPPTGPIATVVEEP
ncbi:ATP-binding protein [Brevibacterium sp.]|uniref:sensor histidine kinase n=1 Tax=Brevibacterium sp. TaxID=1701 RepID=UPI0028124A9D|nr:ATP-binding protein [Brevibacterium sp.]